MFLCSVSSLAWMNTWQNVRRTLHCADGRFSLGNMHNYQHAASYPAFILSGKHQFRLACPTLQTDAVET